MSSLVAIPAALAVGATLGLLGVGGSILTVPILVYLLDIAPRTATTMSLVVVAVASLAAALLHARERHVRLAVAAHFVTTGAPAAYLGGRLSHQLSEPALLLGFGAFMLAAAIAILRKRDDAPPAHTQRHAVMAALSGAVIGLVTGILGAGGGFLVVPALALLVPLPMREAIGTSLVVITANAAVGLVARSGAVELPLELTALFASMALVGAVIGHTLGKRLPVAMLRRLFAGLVLLVAVYMIWKNLGAANVA